MADTTIYFWTDFPERVYVVLRARAGHWRVEWGYRDPPGGPNYLEQGHHETSVAEDAVRLALEHIRRLSQEPGEAERIEPELRAALQSGS